MAPLYSSDPLQALCVNEAVRRLGSSARISEKCLDLQQGGSRRKRAVTAGPARDAAGALFGSLEARQARPAKAAAGCSFLERKASSQRHLKARRTSAWTATAPPVHQNRNTQRGFAGLSEQWLT